MSNAISANRGRPGLGRDEDGAAAVEFALVFLVMLLVTLGTIEVGSLLYQVNSAQKAVLLGARKAVVSNLAAPGLAAVGTAPVASNWGAACSAADGTVNADCLFADVTCTSTGCSGYGYDGTAFAAILAEVQRVFPAAQAANLQVLYGFSGLGFVGRPTGQPVMITVRLVNLTYTSLVLNVLSNLPSSLTLPTIGVTLAGESQQS